MFRVFGALTGRGNSNAEMTQEEKTKYILKQAHDFEIALQAMDYVLDDRAQEGLQLLRDNEPKDGSDQTINVLARGVIEFLEATLGFEAEEMKKASATLAKAEQLSLKSRQNAQKLNVQSSSLYPPGTVYAVTYTESCLLHALLMLFSESMMEAAKALLKLRKAYSMLQEIFEAIKKAEKTQRLTITEDPNESQTSFSSGESSFKSADIPYRLSPEEQDNRDLLEYAEKVHQMRMKRLCGAHIGNSPAINRLRDELGLDAMRNLPQEEIKEFTHIFDDLDVTQATIDEFIHSGVNLCFGILQVVLSLIPPAIGAVLSIVGFHGSRDEGLRLVWRATRQRNVHGCIGLLGLMFYYDGPFQFTDDDFDIPAVDTSSLEKVKTQGSQSTVVALQNTRSSLSPSTSSLKKKATNDSTTSLRRKETNGSTYSLKQHSSMQDGDLDGPTLLHPGKILVDALLRSRALFPNSALWLLNEARMLSARGRLEEAVNLLDSIDVQSISMRQVKSLLVFDRAITLSHLHRYDRAAEDLLSLTSISDWSHAFYTYFAGCCYLENWRMCQLGEMKSDQADFYKKKAEELIFNAPSLLGKKTFKSKNLPLDRFMLRKVQQFKTIQDELGLVDPLDAIATSPVHEISYFYNGYNRMTKEGLELSKRMLTEYHNPAIDAKDEDQEMIKNFLVALSLRRLGEVQEGCDLMDEKLLPKIFWDDNGKIRYVKRTEDPWLYPAALYERALFSWKLHGMDGLRESREWLVRAQNYADDYELSTRIGMKIKAALDRVEHSLNG